MRRKLQLGAEPRREDEDEKREEQLLFPFPAEEESSGSWTRITDRYEAIQPSTILLVGSLQAPNVCLLLCLSRSISLKFFFCTLREGGTRARPWVSRRGASFQHAYFSPKYPYLPDLVFNDSLFQVQHRLDYLSFFSPPRGETVKIKLNE